MIAIIYPTMRKCEVKYLENLSWYRSYVNKGRQIRIEHFFTLLMSL